MRGRQRRVRCNVEHPGPVVGVEWLASQLDAPQVVTLEVSSMAGEAARYALEGHVPGSQFAWWKDLCWHESDREFPTPEVMAERLRARGVSDDSVLVLVGDPIQFATYAYWVLAMTGLDHVASVLDGGRRAWVAAGLPLVRDAPRTRPPGNVRPRAVEGTSARVGRDNVLAHLGSERVLIDMRTDEEYSGDRVSPSTMAFDHGAERTGRIPGARHLYFERLLSESGTFLPPREITAQLASVGASPGADVVTYCRLSHRATLGWFAATRLADWPGVRVYDGSWTEWGSIVGFPIER